MLDDLQILRYGDEDDLNKCSFYLNGAKLDSVVGYEYEQDNPHVAYVTLKLAIHPFKEARS